MSCLPHRRYDALQFQSSYSPLVSTTAYSDLDSLLFTPVSGQKPENDMPSFLPTPVASYPSPQLIQCSRILSSGMTSVFASSLRGDSLHPFVLKGSLFGVGNMYSENGNQRGMGSDYALHRNTQSNNAFHGDTYSSFSLHRDINPNHTLREDTDTNLVHCGDISKNTDHLSFSDVSNSFESAIATPQRTPNPLSSCSPPIQKPINSQPDQSASTSHPHFTLQRGIDDEAEEYSRRGTALFQSKAYEEAFQQFTAALRCTPSDSILLSNRAACLLAMKKPNRALKDALYVTQLDPERSHGFMRSGQCYLLLGELTKSE